MQPLTAECEWYKLCSNGTYLARRCPTDRTGQRQMFNPTTNSCTDKVKIPVDGKCQSYKTCLSIETVSPYGKWTELSCESGKHFDQESQKCIEEATSTCGKYFQGFIFQIFFKVVFKNKYNFRTSEVKACDEKTCLNGGICQEDGSDEYDCLCPIGYTGKNCECNYNNFSQINSNYSK